LRQNYLRVLYPGPAGSPGVLGALISAPPRCLAHPPTTTHVLASAPLPPWRHCLAACAMHSDTSVAFLYCPSCQQCRPARNCGRRVCLRLTPLAVNWRWRSLSECFLWVGFLGWADAATLTPSLGRNMISGPVLGVQLDSAHVRNGRHVGRGAKRTGEPREALTADRRRGLMFPCLLTPRGLGQRMPCTGLYMLCGRRAMWGWRCGIRGGLSPSLSVSRVGASRTGIFGAQKGRRRRQTWPPFVPIHRAGCRRRGWGGGSRVVQG
jgi:hypothetical protein